MQSYRVLRERFVAHLPRIERHARIYFRHIRCWHTKEDLVQETLAMSWKWFVRLYKRGKDPTTFISVLASLAARSVKCGRTVCGMERKKDAMSKTAQMSHQFRVEALPHCHRICYGELYTCDGQPHLDEVEERLQDNTHTEIPEQVQFRIDFPVWLKRHTDRNREIIREMIREERTKDIAQKFGTSEGRISQLRKEFYLDWELFL